MPSMLARVVTALDRFHTEFSRIAPLRTAAAAHPSRLPSPDHQRPLMPSALQAARDQRSCRRPELKMPT